MRKLDSNEFQFILKNNDFQIHEYSELCSSAVSIIRLKIRKSNMEVLYETTCYSLSKVKRIQKSRCDNLGSVELKSKTVFHSLCSFFPNLKQTKGLNPFQLLKTFRAANSATTVGKTAALALA